MNTYLAYKNKEIDLSAFGLDHCGNDYTCFCTPVGADIFASPGVDGIHYCMIKGFGEMVFAVSPMNCPGEYVHPVARNFDDFLALLMICDGDAAIEQCWQWSQEQFDAFVNEQEYCPESKVASIHLMELTGLEPMGMPYKYLRDLQKSFNYKSISFTEEYYETVPVEDLTEPDEVLCEQPSIPWAVYYDTNFWAKTYEGTPCEEMFLERHFSWAGREWYIPSVYICEKGMVTDIFMRVNTDEFQAFMDKWDITLENEHTLSEEQRRQIELENPLSFHFSSDVIINGETMNSSSGCSTIYAPFRCEIDSLEWQPILDYYNLDRKSCWVIQRSCYPWVDKSITDIATMEVTMSHQPMFKPGATFETKETGEVHTFQNTITGIMHTLTINKYEKQELDCDFPWLKNHEYPRHYIVMNFTLEPELSQTEFSITDTQQSERTRVIPNQASDSKSLGAAAVSIIGGTDGPTAIIVGSSKDKGSHHTAISRFCFEPFATVKWQLSFKEERIPETVVKLV